MTATDQETGGTPPSAEHRIVEDMLLVDRFRVVASPAPQDPPGEGGGVSETKAPW